MPAALQASQYREHIVLILGQFGLAELDDVGSASSAFRVVTPVWSRRLWWKLLRKRRRRRLEETPTSNSTAA
jgi:hypothetical protein